MSTVLRTLLAEKELVEKTTALECSAANSMTAEGVIAPLGRHLIADFYGCPADVLANPALITERMLAAATAGEATVLQQHFHYFGVGQGVTGVLLLKESHISIHTWPEHNYAAIDLFMCGAASADAALSVLQQALSPQTVEQQVIVRGMLA